MGFSSSDRKGIHKFYLYHVELVRVFQAKKLQFLEIFTCNAKFKTIWHRFATDVLRSISFIKFIISINRTSPTPGLDKHARIGSK